MQGSMLQGQPRFNVHVDCAGGEGALVPIVGRHAGRRLMITLGEVCVAGLQAAAFVCCQILVLQMQQHFNARLLPSITEMSVHQLSLLHPICIMVMSTYPC